VHCYIPEFPFIIDPSFTHHILGSKKGGLQKVSDTIKIISE